MNPQEFSDRFGDDFHATAKQIEPGGALSIGTVRSALSNEPTHELPPFDKRCERIYAAFSYLHENKAELERLHLLYIEDSYARMTTGLESALHIFFQSGDFVLPKKPRLDLFIKAAFAEQKKLKP